MEIPVSKGSKFEVVHIEEGMYKAVFKDIRSNGVKTFNDGSVAEQFILEFAIVEKDVTLPYFAYGPVTVGNKLGQAFLAMGANVADLEKLDTDKYTGSDVKVLVETYEKEYNGNKEKSSIITKVKAREGQ